MTPVARLGLFGVPVLLGSDGAPVKLRSVKQLGALVYLALEGRDQPVSRDRLVDLLWSDVPPERGRHSLAQACSAIRAALGPGALGRLNGAVRLEAVLETDLDVVAGEFERLSLTEPLREAEWWAGPEFAHWVEGARGRLRRAAEEALRRAVADFRRQGQTARVHAAADVLYRLDPLSDTAVHALAERELIAGDVVGAIRLLRTHLARVRDALGCSPHRDVERLLRRLEAGSHPPVEQFPSRLAAETQNLKQSVFVGREKEIASLESEWQRTGEGSFQSCLVLGPAGMGKSSLVRRFAATAAARAQPVFLVTCQEIGEGIPFAALSDLVTALTRDPSISGTDPRALAEVARIHPSLRLQYPGIPEPPEVPPEAIRIRVAGGLLQMLEAVSDACRLCIVFDDLPFMDAATRDVLHVLARRLDARPILLVATARTSELLGTSTPSSAWRSMIDWKTTIRLSALSREAVRKLASALSPQLVAEHRVLERIEQLSEGNPHFAEMLVVDWESYANDSLAGDAGANGPPDNWLPPDSLRQAFAHIYAGLGDSAQQVLHVLAVASRSVRPDELPAFLAAARPDLDDIVLNLLRRGILRLDNGLLSFKNELHRAYAYYAISPDLRRFYHSRLGRALLVHDEKDYMSRLEAVRHLAKAGLNRVAEEALLPAARLALEHGAPVEAEAALRSVLATSVDTAATFDLKLALVESVSAQGRYAEALKLLDHMHVDASHLQARAAIAFLRAQALQRVRLTDDQTIQQAIQHALMLAVDSGEERLLAATAQIVAEAASEMWDPRMLAEAAGMARRLTSTSSSDPTRARALLTMGFCLLASGRFNDALPTLRESSRLLKASRLEADLMRALNGEGLCLMAIGGYQEALQSYAAAARVASKLNDSAHLSGILANIGCSYEDVGMFSEAEMCYIESIRCNAKDLNSRVAVTSHVNAAQIALIKGDYDGATQHIALAREASQKTHSWRLAALVDFSQADVFLAIGEAESAWSIVAGAAASTWGKERALDTNGKQIRLTLHLALMTGGEERLKALVGELATSRRPLRLAHLMEVAGFLAWAVRTGALSRDHLRGTDLDVEPTGLRGPVAILSAVRTPVRDEWGCRPGESALEMTLREFLAEAALPPVSEILQGTGVSV